jgi:hypothetical protein
LIAGVTKSRYMPPWHAAHGFGEFMEERRLNDEQIGLIGQWVKEGMPQGDPAKLPTLPKFTEGWLLGKPDLIVTMPKGFALPASGPDIYRNFVSVEPHRRQVGARRGYHPGTRAVVHHCLFSYDATGSLRKRRRRWEAGLRRHGRERRSTGHAKSGHCSRMPSGSLGGWAVARHRCR